MSRPIKDWFAKTFDDWVDEGYPEEIIPDILSGDLPMDEASKAARAAEQDYGPVLYRGHPHNNRPTSDQDMWMSSSEDVAGSYVQGYPMQSRMEDWGEVTPLRHNAGNLAEVNGRGKTWKSVQTNPRKLPGLKVDDPNINRPLKGTDDISEAVKGSGNYQGTLFRNIKDESTLSGGAEKADTYNVLGSRPDVKIRHADAAFHPTYKGPNIKGSADPRLLGGMAVGLTTAGLVAPEIAQRFPMPDAGNRAGWLESVTNWGDATQNSLRAATGGVSDYFFPESVNDYLKKVNAVDEDPTWSDRFWAGLDVFGVLGK